MRCHVRINATSGYCTLCGAVQRPPWPRGRRRAAIAAIVVIAAAGVLAVSLGALSPAPEPALRPYRAADLVGLVPGGWVGGKSVTPRPGVAVTTFSDPLDDRRSLTVTLERPAPLTALARARLARAGERVRGGFRQRFFGRVQLSVHRPAWLLTYQSATAFHAVYVYSVCAPAVAITVELRAPRRADLLGPLERIPASTQPRC